MNKRQEAYKSMAMKTIGEMHRHNAIWKGNKVISGTVTKIETLFEGIDTANARQNMKTEGATQKKNSFRKQIDKTTDIFLGIFRSYAKTTGNDELYQNSNLSLSEIKDIKDTEITVLANSTVKYAENNKEQLKDYGMSADMIKNYSTAIDGYKEYLTRPQEIKAEKKTATAELKDLFKQLDEQLTEYLDNHMMQFVEKEPQFYSDYENARIIYDDPTTSKSLMGTVSDVDSDCDGTEDKCPPLQNVKVHVKFKAGSELADSVKSTSKKGNFQFKGLKEGVYTVTFEKFEYETVTKEIEIHKNAMTRLNIKMKRINL
jgi:hypothetical protein